LGKEFSREGVIAAETLRLGDKAEQPLRIATRKRGHGISKIRRSAYSHNRTAALMLGTPRRVG
jgi:hypothetical protein